MEITPDYTKLESSRLSAEELQSAFSIALLNAAAVDCGTVVDPDVLHAEFGESVAMNLALAKRFAPQEAETYRVILIDYLRFCKMYIEGSDVSEDGFDKAVYDSLIRAIRAAYWRGKKEIPIG